MLKTVFLLAVCVTTIVGLYATGCSTVSAKQDDMHTTLKILPKDISDDDLEAIMKSFNVALGVKCGHCHAPRTDGKKGLDFESDANPKKLIARDMMLMTTEMNNKYFHHYKRDSVFVQMNCNTCHNGKTKPLATEIPADKL